MPTVAVMADSVSVRELRNSVSAGSPLGEMTGADETDISVTLGEGRVDVRPAVAPLRQARRGN